jgi:hypothetical protein
MKLKQWLESIPTPAETRKEIQRGFFPVWAEIADEIEERLPLTPYKVERAIKDALIDKVVTAASAIRASNPNLLSSLEIERSKKRCISEQVCDPDAGEWDGDKCKFTIYRILKECGCYNSSLRDKKIAKRHLEAEVSIGDLEKEIKDGRTYYVHENPEKLYGLKKSLSP